jgi:hypothetical protein
MSVRVASDCEPGGLRNAPRESLGSSTPSASCNSKNNGVVAHPGRPPAPDVYKIPEELKSLRQWVLWRYEFRGDAWTKIPYQPLKLKAKAKADDPTTWGSFDLAWEAYQKSDFDGIGFEFSATDEFFGVDVDKCLDEQNQVLAWAAQILAKLETTYGEISPSRRGIKFIARGKLPGATGTRRSGMGDGTGALELYDHGRFFTLTGDRYGTGIFPKALQQVADELYGLAKERPKHAPEATGHTDPWEQTVVGETLEARIIAYLATCDPAVSGQRGHDTTLRVACAIGPGFNLTANDAFRYLCDHYNGRCRPPWEERDLRRKVSEAFKVEPRRGWLLDSAKPLNGYTHSARAAASGKAPSTDGKRTMSGTRIAEKARNVMGNGERLAACPEILITTEEDKVNDQAVAALASDPELYRLGYVLATILQEGDSPRGVEYTDGPPPQITPIEAATLRERMAKTAIWKMAKMRGDRTEVIPAHPPAWSVSAVLKRGIWPVRPIVGVIEAPTIRRDGSIMSVKGYDPVTRLYLRPNVVVDSIPDRPTKQDAESARDLIYDLVSDFPFKDDTHKSVWLASLLTVVARASFAGPAPLFAFDGNCPGSGKTKLADLVAIVASGRRMPRSIWPAGRNADEEVRKRITSMALAGERFALLDNIDSPLGGGPIDAALTSDTWRDRLLGSNTMTPELPLITVWFASGNNIQYRGDFIRRVLPGRLESPLERPEERTGFKYSDLLGHTLANRGTILRAALVIIRGFHAAGRPALVMPLGSFEGWSRAIVDPVIWVTGINPLDVRTEVKAGDQGSQVRAALVHGWADLPGAKDGITVAAALKVLRDDDKQLHYGDLRAALMELSDKGDLPSAQTIGRILNTCKGRNFGEYSLTGTPNRSKTFVWKVVHAPKPGSAGDAGDTGDVASRSHVQAQAGAHTPMASIPASPASPAPKVHPLDRGDWTKYP